MKILMLTMRLSICFTDVMIFGMLIATPYFLWASEYRGSLVAWGAYLFFGYFSFKTWQKTGGFHAWQKQFGKYHDPFSR